MATSWGFNVDASVLTVKLREGLKWSDGEDFNADDVVYTWQLFQGNDALGGNDVRTALNFIRKIENVDDYTVQFVSDEINTTAIHGVGGRVIVSEHIWSSVDDPVTYANEEPVGTGAFMLERFEEQIYELTANPNYWRGNRRTSWLNGD